MKDWIKSSHGDGVGNAVRGVSLVVAATILWWIHESVGLPYGEIVETSTEFGQAFGVIWAAYGFTMKGVVAFGSK